MKEFIIELIGIIVLAAIFIVFYPFLLFWVGYFSGWLAKLVIGTKLAAALNIAFHTTWFTAEMLPMIGGALAWVGSFFKGTTRTVETKKRKSSEKNFI
jgi:hypothetical protein